MAEWLMAADCKSAALTCYGGSNPSLPTMTRRGKGAHVAQPVEHVLGKDGVSSSSLLVGSMKNGSGEPRLGCPQAPSVAEGTGRNAGVTQG
jgi:hypothetical protein